MMQDMLKRKVKKWIFATLGISGVLTVAGGFFILMVATSAVENSQRAVMEMVARAQASEDNYFNSEVLYWQPVVEEWAEVYDILDWVPELMAIMQIESRGLIPDLMNSSASAGLPPNTLEYEESIVQGVRHLATLINHANTLGIGRDRLAIIQSYNFGIGYLDWLASRGQTHDIYLSAYYSRNVIALSGGNLTGERFDYINVISTGNGKPFLYIGGGNFHYAYLVRHLTFMMHVGGAYMVDGGILPLDPPFWITSGFGPRWGSHHAGIDLSSGFGAPIRAVKAGRVTRVVNNFGSNDGFLGHPGGFGNVVFIEHDGGIVTVYAHLMSTVPVRVDSEVAAGQVIGFQGNSGNSTGSHLHFGMKRSSITE